MTLDPLLDAFVLDKLNVPHIAGAPAPLSLTPRAANIDVGSLLLLMPFILEAAADRGALLVRGLDEIAAQSMSELAEYCRNMLGPYKTREHPASAQSTSVWHPIEYARGEKLLWHHEDSFNLEWPQVIMFGCARPADNGGESCLVDGRLLHQRASQSALSSVESGIIYRRLCDGYTGRSWQELFLTDSREKAMHRAKSRSESLFFTPEGAVVEAVRPSFISTHHGEVWFNQLLHWHPRALPDTLREYVARGLVTTHRSCRTGDGHQIADDTVNEIMELCHEIEQPLLLRQKDLLVLDNRVFAHGRNAFVGSREIFVLLAGAGRYG